MSKTLARLSTNANSACWARPRRNTSRRIWFHTGGKSFLSPNYHVFPPAQFMVNRRSEESTRVGIAPDFRSRLELLAEAVVLDGECAEELTALLARLHAELQPARPVSRPVSRK